MSVFARTRARLVTLVPAFVRAAALHAAFAYLLIGALGFIQRDTRPLPQALLQQAAAGQADRITRPTSEPYRGDLSIFEKPGRDEKLQVNRVMDVLGIKEGSGVADIGAGSGWFTVRAARRTGAGGTVYAVEINPDYLMHIEERARQEGLPNIRCILGKEDDPMLPPHSVDAVLILKTYHEIAQPIRLLARLRRALRSGALLGIIDRNGNGDDHGISPKVIIDEASRAGFSLVEQYDFVKGDDVDYFLVFGVQEHRLKPVPRQ